MKSSPQVMDRICYFLCMNSDAPISAQVIADNITRLRKEVSTKEDELNSLHAELEWWETGQELFGEVPEEQTDQLPLEKPEENVSTNGAKPPLRDRILAVLALEPRKTWKTEALIAEMEERGWMPSGGNAEHQVRSMLSQMHRKGQARRMSRGMYRLPPERKDQSKLEAAGSIAAGVATGALLAAAAHSVSGGA
jgi:hypothetical protein